MAEHKIIGGLLVVLALLGFAVDSYASSATKKLDLQGVLLYLVALIGGYYLFTGK